MNVNEIKLIAMDLDGTLTQHKEQLDKEHKMVLDALSKKYKLLMVGAGQTMRIFNQMNQYPIDIIGNYGLQFAKYNEKTKTMDTLRDEIFEIDKEDIELLKSREIDYDTSNTHMLHIFARNDEADNYNITVTAQSMEVLLEWNQLDPVDSLERTRNEEAAKIQGNRNPFIDNYMYAELIWSSTRSLSNEFMVNDITIIEVEYVVILSEIKEYEL